MANVVVVYATREGQTAKIAQRIAIALRENQHTVELIDAEHASPQLELERFDAAIVGAPIHVGGYPRSVARFVKNNRAFLESVPSAFFSVGLAVASRTTDGRGATLSLVEKFLAKTGWRPRRVELVAGALPYSKYNFLIRFVMRRIAAKEGGDTDTSRDYEYTDWEAVARFALDFVASSSVEAMETAATGSAA
jgi:menaquinone-dependent protoporphyrinogen oxidase